MKRFSLLLAVAAFAVLPIHAAEEDAAALAVEYLELSKTPEIIQQTIETYADQLSGGDPKKQEAIRSKLQAEMGWEVLEKPIATIVLENLSPGELKEINAFYRTPAGQALAGKSPQMSAQLSTVIADNIRKATATLPSDTAKPKQAE